MAITIDGSSGIASVDGSAGSPSIRGSDANSGILYTADAIKFSTGGTQRAAIDNNGLSSTGHVLQHVYADTTTQVANTDGNFTDTGLTANITPRSSSNKIIILAQIQFFIMRNATETSMGIKLLRDSTEIMEHSTSPHIECAVTSQNRIIMEGCIPFLKSDSPSTTSQITYKIQFRTSVTANSGEARVQHASERSTIQLLEVAG